MRIGNIEFRKPWVKYVEVPLEEEIYWAVRKSIGEDIAKEIEAELEDECESCGYGYCDCGAQNNFVIKRCADIARGQK